MTTHHLHRRAVLAAGVALGVAGCTTGTTDSDGSDPDAANSTGSSPSASAGEARHQEGIITPLTPQPHQLTSVWSVSATTPQAWLALLATLGTAATAAMQVHADEEVTVTIGIGPRLVRQIDSKLPGTTDMPGYPRESMTSATRQGDLLINVCAQNLAVCRASTQTLRATLGDQATLNWSQVAFRTPPVATLNGSGVSRNVFGFADGIIQPSEEERNRDVWFGADSPLAGGTLAVFRRFELDRDRFTALPVSRQEEIFGRRRKSGAPLSGGTIETLPSLTAKTPDGRYLEPINSHTRVANAMANGVGIMQRRGYALADPSGLMFVCFQNELRTFDLTLARMVEEDDLFSFTKTTATGTFLIPAGYSEDEPLGSQLSALLS